MCDVSFVIIEYHCLEDIGRCVESIRDVCDNQFHYEVIISSNSQYDVTKQKKILQRHPNTRWLFNAVNGGFAYGMNKGLDKSNGRVLVIMNPDVTFLNHNLGKAYEYLLRNENVGILGPKILDFQGDLQDSCRGFMGPIELMKRQIKRVIKKQDVLLETQYNYDQAQTVDWIIGAFMMLRRDVYEKIEGFDEDYYLYVEDMDLCKKIWMSGHEVHYYPDLVVSYKGDRKSTKSIFQRTLFDKYTYYHVRSYLRFLRKHGLKTSSQPETT